MKEEQMIDLFWQRDKSALQEVEQAYEHLLYHIAKNVTGSEEDAKECVNDTYLRLWDSIPPKRPESLRNYAARIVRNLAIDIYRKNKSRNKDNEISLVCEELEGIIADGKNEYDKVEFQQLVNGFLASISQKERMLFVRRYWQADSIKELAKWSGMKESAVKMRLSRTREKFRDYLEKGGVQV